ncbi:MAG: serine hydrolase, partial [Bacteroidota bacterium]
GYYLLGVIIEKLSGMSYADFLHKNIFEPLDMENAYYGDFQQLIPNRAAGYQQNEKGYVNAPYLSMSLPYAAGSLLMNVADLYKWNRALKADKLLKPANLAKAYTAYKLNNGEETGYGYGWSLQEAYDQKIIEHGGGIHGFLTQANYVPDEDLFVAVFSNCNCQAPQTIAQIITAVEMGKYELKEKVQLPAATLEEYKGIYKITDNNDKRTIRVKDGQLSSQRTGGDLSNLYAYAKDKFFFENSLTMIHFQRDASGKVTGMETIRPSGKNDLATLTDEAIVERKEMKLSETILQRYVGEYELMPGFSLDIKIEEGQLVVVPTGQSKQILYAESETDFFLKTVDAQLAFSKGDDGSYSKVILYQGGQQIEGTRK